MKYLMAIALMLGNFTLAQANETPRDEYGCSVGEGLEATDCRLKVRLRLERKRQESREYQGQGRFSKVTDIDPLAETAQGGDRDGDVCRGDFGGENDRAVASTTAE